jgi:SAM-dependent methyltransferase
VLHADRFLSTPGRGVDFGATAADYARHRAGFPDPFFERLVALGIGLPGQRLVDLATGTGTLARGFARRGCRVVGVDRAPAILAEARRLARADGVAHAGTHPSARPSTHPSARPSTHAAVHAAPDGAPGAAAFVVARAEQVPLRAGCADVVTAGTSWHWFDRPAAMQEVARLLVDAGVLVIANLHWLPLPGNVPGRTEALILEHNPAWQLAGQSGAYPEWARELAAAGFRDVESSLEEVTIGYTQEAWRGRARACSGVGAMLPPEAVARFDADLARLLAERYGTSHLEVPHTLFCIIARRATAGAR